MGKYRFGFNGQEKVNEIAGVGNHNTAEFWEYDSRTARRWNTDPVVKPWESSYAAFNGNPIAKTDIKGDDARVEKIPNSSGGGGTINISTTIHVEGSSKENVDKFIASAEEYLKNNGQNLGGTYTDDEGGIWNIKLNISYVDAKDAKFEDGDNTMNISQFDKIGFSSVVYGGDIEQGDFTNGRWVENGEFDFNMAGKFGAMRHGLNNGKTTFHEALHMLGLSDRYEDIYDNRGNRTSIPHTGYEYDVMHNGNTMHQNHWNNWGRAILQNPDSKFILRQRVDIQGDRKVKYLQPENRSTYRGTVNGK